jgi:chromosome segregation ATPase
MLSLWIRRSGTVRRLRSWIWIVAGVGLLTLVGCNGTPGDSVDIKKLQADLKDANGRNEVLKKDAEKLTDALRQAESSLLQTTDARNKLQLQVEELGKSRDDLTAKVGDLTVARTELTAKVDELNVARTELQKKVADLTQSRDGLQKNVDGLTVARAGLQKQVDDLTKAKNAAMDDAKTAQTKIEQLTNKIKVQAQQMNELQEQIVNIRSVLDHLQQNLQ